MEPTKDQPPPYSDVFNQPPSQFGQPAQPAQPGYGGQPQTAYSQPAAYNQPGQYNQPNPYNQPQAAYPPNQYGQPQQAQATTVVVTQPVTRPALGSCAYCGGYKREEYTACGIILAICFFPIGILCCLAMTEHRCVNCGRM